MFIDNGKVSFWLDGICSDDIGIKLQDFPEFKAAEPKVTIYSIPGRNGDLTYWDGSYKNVSGQFNCFALNAENVDYALTAVNSWLTDCSYKKLVVSSEPGRYRMARVTNAAEIAIRMGVLAPFSITVDCKPQRFIENGSPLLFTGAGGEIQNTTGFPALPVIRLYVPDGSSFLSYQHIRISNNDSEYRLILQSTGISSAKWVEIDLEKQCATRDSGENVSINTDLTGFPKFVPGTTKIYDAEWASKIEVYPRWWTL